MSSCSKVVSRAFLHTWLGAEKTLEGLLPGKNRRRAAAGPEGKNRGCHPQYCMKLIVNLTGLNSEQVKFLSQLGEFRGERTWEAACAPDDSEEAVDLLKRAGIEDVFVQFGN